MTRRLSRKFLDAIFPFSPEECIRCVRPISFLFSSLGKERKNVANPSSESDYGACLNQAKEKEENGNSQGKVGLIAKLRHFVPQHTHHIT